MSLVSIPEEKQMKMCVEYIINEDYYPEILNALKDIKGKILINVMYHGDCNDK